MGFETRIKVEMEIVVKGKQKPDVGWSKYFKKRANVKAINIKSQEVEIIKTEVKADEQMRALNMLKRIATEILGKNADGSNPQFSGSKGWGSEIKPRIHPKDGNAPWQSILLISSDEVLEVRRRGSALAANHTQKFRLADPDLYDNVKKFLGI